jgi:hypothetical protein
MSLNHRVIKQISLNAKSRDLVIQFRGNSSAIEAKALEFKKDEAGNVVYLLLDRLIHKAHENLFECFLNDRWEHGFSVTGCYVTELNRTAILPACAINQDFWHKISPLRSPLSPPINDENL